MAGTAHPDWEAGMYGADERMPSTGANDDVVVVPLDDIRWEVVRLAGAIFAGDEATEADALDRLGRLLRIDQSEILAAARRIRPGTFA